jgi:hypothetical protein
VPTRFSGVEGFDVGEDTGTRVAENYAAPRIKPFYDTSVGMVRMEPAETPILLYDKGKGTVKEIPATQVK